MTIRHITIRDLGSVSLFETELKPELNIIDTRYIPEISAAVAFLLCSKAFRGIPKSWLRNTTRLTAEISIEEEEYTVTAVSDHGCLTLTVTDPYGTEVTDDYRYRLSHCPEQDALDTFDGQDTTLPLRLLWYRNCEKAPGDLSDRTESRTDLKIFRAQLLRYIQSFQPEPIHCKKNYLLSMTPEGRFAVHRPGGSGEVFLSETEEKLFRYLCFLNTAEFWTEVEKLRDLHHEKKPLVIQNFVERLDESVDIRGLMARTARLQRQIVILTRSPAQDIKT